MSAQANPATFEELEGEGNGVDLDTMEPINHNYDSVGHIVLAECCVCCNSGGRRLLSRDYDLQDDFKQSLVEDDDDYVPSAIYRDCGQCGKETTHFVC